MLSISQFAQLCGTNVKTIRFYDNKGLLPASYISPENRYRYYKPEAANLFRKIIWLKDAGFTLRQIQDILSVRDPAVLRKIIEDHLTQLDSQREKSASLLKAVDNLSEWTLLKELSVTEMITIDMTKLLISIVTDEGQFDIHVQEESILEPASNLLRDILEHQTMLIGLSPADLQSLASEKTLAVFHSSQFKSCEPEIAMANVFPDEVLSAHAVLIDFKLPADEDQSKLIEMMTITVAPLEQSADEIYLCTHFDPHIYGPEVRMLGFVK